MTKPTWDEYFMGVAKAVSTRATCPRKSVGAVIVRDYDKKIVATGYNGAQSKTDECIDVGCDIRCGHCVRTIHAEMNALCYSILSPKLKYTLYVTLEPCDNCYGEIGKYPIYSIIWDESQAEYRSKE